MTNNETMVQTVHGANRKFQKSTVNTPLSVYGRIISA